MNPAENGMHSGRIETNGEARAEAKRLNPNPETIPYTGYLGFPRPLCEKYIIADETFPFSQINFEQIIEDYGSDVCRIAQEVIDVYNSIEQRNKCFKNNPDLSDDVLGLREAEVDALKSHFNDLCNIISAHIDVPKLLQELNERRELEMAAAIYQHE